MLNEFFISDETVGFPYFGWGIIESYHPVEENSHILNGEMEEWQAMKEKVDFKVFGDLSSHPKELYVAYPSQAIIWTVSQGCLLDAFLPKFEDYLLASLYFEEMPEKLEIKVSRKHRRRHREIEWKNETPGNPHDQR